MRDSAQFGHHEFSVIIGWCRVVTYSVLLIRLEWARLYTRWLHRSLIFPCWPNRALPSARQSITRGEVIIKIASTSLGPGIWSSPLLSIPQLPITTTSKIKATQTKEEDADSHTIDTIANTVTKNMTKWSTASASLVRIPYISSRSESLITHNPAENAPRYSVQKFESS